MSDRQYVPSDTEGRGVVVVEREAVVAERPVVTEHAAADAVDHQAVTTHADGWSLTRGYLRMFNALVAFFLLALEAVLAFRLAFALGGANPANGFVDFIYDLSGPFVSPFENIANEQVNGSSVFEPETVIAMAVYAVAALLVVVFVNIIASVPAASRTEAVTSERHARVDREV